LDYLPLRLTSVRMPKFEMGRRAAQLLIRHIEARETLPPQKVYLDSELVVRDSTRAVESELAAIRPSRIRVAAGDAAGAQAESGNDTTAPAAGSTAGRSAR
ncbi:MAG TPA: substrate-binding domain-containing protein, partial [Longimicrobium sp.]|nr:substrate-binding domain-containing protein [Longimicrobium sp.]